MKGELVSNASHKPMELSDSVHPFLGPKRVNGPTRRMTWAHSPRVSDLVSLCNIFLTLFQEIFALGVEKTKEKTYFALSPGLSGDDMASIFTRVTGRPAIHSPSSSDEFAELTTSLVGPAFKEDAKQMMEWAAVMPKDRICYGSLSPEVDKSKEELGLQATSFEDWLRRSGWTGPTEVYE